MSVSVSQAQIGQWVDEAVASTPVYDLHTHLYPAGFGKLMLWGIDELLTYHYLIADTIVDAVRGVARGEQGWLSRKIAAKMSIWIRDDDQDPRKLTMREIEVLRLLTEGKTNQGIGAALGISEKTVEKYLDSMFKKLGVNSRVDAAVRAVREGII
jgi:DNA-binding NarL/FixJ family response regulator